MIEIAGTSIDIVGLFEEGQATNLDLNIELDEQLGLSLPTITISFNYDLFKLVESLYKDKEFEVIIAKKSYKFRLVQFTCISNRYTVMGMVKNPDFITTKVQNSSDDTSVKTIEKVKSIQTIAGVVNPLDQQVWLQNNISDREFIRNILAHSWIDGKDFLVYYVTLENTLLLDSYANLVNQEPIVFGKKIGNLNFNNGVNTEGIPIMYYDLVNNSLGVVTQNAASNSYSNDNTSISPSSFMINAGNCHENYFVAPVRNLQLYMKLFDRLHNLEITGYSKIKPMSCISIEELPEHKANNKSTITSKKYIVSRVKTSIKSHNILQTIYFNRIL